MSSGRVTDQKPFSCGNSVISDVQCTGQLARSSLKSSCGGPSSHRSRSRTLTSFRVSGWAAIRASYRKLDTLSGFGRSRARGAHRARRRAVAEREVHGQGRLARDRRDQSLGHRRAVLEAVSRAAPDEPDTGALRMLAREEVRVGGDLVAARADLVE